MISFRAQAPESSEWDSISFDGDHEDLLAHLFAKMLSEAGWDFLADASGVPMDWED